MHEFSGSGSACLTAFVRIPLTGTSSPAIGSKHATGTSPNFYTWLDLGTSLRTRWYFTTVLLLRSPARERWHVGDSSLAYEATPLTLSPPARVPRVLLHHQNPTMKFALRNPISFTPLPVTIITSVIYAALIVALLVVHLVVPPAPASSTPVAGINLTEAWLDLRLLTQTYHPYNSRPNDHVRDWLLRRIEAILESNGVSPSANDERHHLQVSSIESPAVVFSDVTSNVSFSAPGSAGEPGTSVYFEGTNILVYIRGSEGEEGSWWLKEATPSKGGVLVNAHYDSVSTGFGATDDGVGVVTVLQLIKHFTTKGKQPKKGIVALLNNGEEDSLNGARAFSQHPMSRFAHTFLNLEGAGAGGRAALFRSTDTEITRAYKGARYPFGNCGSGDEFKRGFVRSQTDYIVFNGLLGLRGLDVAFLDPRARYHTDQDDTRHTSINSLWHMLSASLVILETLSSDTSSTFEGKAHEKGKVPSGKGTTGVWFDMFGQSFAVLNLRTLFALSITLLVVGPIILILLGVILSKVDKFYLFSSSKHHHHQEGDDTVPLQGLRGITRFPVIFLAASAAVVALAFLVAKLNPYVVYSSPYAVWSMMLSAWLFVAWFLSRAIDFARPTALHRAYSLLWMFLLEWVILVVVTVYEQRLKIAGDYFLVFYFGAVFLSTFISFLELFGLQRKSVYADEFGVHEYGEVTGSCPRSSSSSRLLATNAEEQPPQSPTVEPEDGEEEEGQVADESTSLLRSSKRATFARQTSPHQNANAGKTDPLEEKQARVFGFEQAWSWSLPTSTWLLQFLLLAVVPVILAGQIGLLLVTGTYQTLADGNPPLPLYLSIAVFSVLVLAPLTPYLHRYTYHIPTFLFLVLIGTLIYNVVAFPFSTNNRLKLFFLQKVDLDTGINQVLLTGVGDPYLAEAINSLPSAAGQKRECTASSIWKGLTECAWHGISPEVVRSPHPEIPPHHTYSDWLTFHIFRAPNSTEARIRLWGRNTRACKIQFNQPISDFRVEGAGDDKRFQRVPEEGSKEIRLWSRTWEKEWTVKVKWQPQPGNGYGIDGRVVCLWSDDNETGVIPALDEIRHFAPDWVAVTKNGDGLVEGSKAFLV